MKTFDFNLILLFNSKVSNRVTYNQQRFFRRKYGFPNENDSVEYLVFKKETEIPPLALSAWNTPRRYSYILNRSLTAKKM